MVAWRIKAWIGAVIGVADVVLGLVADPAPAEQRQAVPVGHHSGLHGKLRHGLVLLLVLLMWFRVWLQTLHQLNGDKLFLSDNIMVLFETDNLSVASPATVARSVSIFIHGMFSVHTHVDACDCCTWVGGRTLCGCVCVCVCVCMLVGVGGCMCVGYVGIACKEYNVMFSYYLRGFMDTFC